MAEVLSREFDSVLVVPCGPRPDKQTVNDVDTVHRATLADIAFRGLDRVNVELFDLEQSVFSRTDQLQDRYQHLGDLWHVVGSDLTQGGEASAICRHWERGLEIWTALKFLVITRDGCSAKEGELPPQCRLISLEIPSGASSIIRERIFKREPFAHMVTPDIAAYIERYGLYRGRIPSRETRFALQTPRLLVFGDERNPRAVEVMKSLERWVDYKDPNCVVVVGGDGTMLRAIRKHWRRRLPFFGINTGHLGFLLNRAADHSTGKFEPGEMTLYQLPMLYVEMDGVDGVTRDALAFNDAWIERATSQCAKIEVHVNEKLRIQKLIADGLLVSTAAGSTAYARSMGASPLLVDTPGWLLVGSNVINPPGWKSALLAMDASAEFIVENTAKRPVSAFVGGEAYGEVTRMRVRMSRIAAVELAFGAQHDIAEKIASIQFPASPIID
ncbi:MAG: NAD(+)/NADH kinase [Acidobacteriota bacterium]|nr:NAD(+)/NADH kinase [Acidobacteriota bacterium]